MTPRPLDPLEVLARVSGDGGLPGLALFVGTVRADRELREVVVLDYDTYHDLAVREMGAICEEAAAAFGATCAMAHRTGPVAVGEPSVAAAAAAPGDAGALEACEWMVEQLKARVPIWKMQRFADGGAAWADGP